MAHPIIFPTATIFINTIDFLAAAQRASLSANMASQRRGLTASLVARIMLEATAATLANTRP
jgi:hypothetical protein